MLTFAPGPHEYRLNGVVLPSVTQIINQWVKVEAGWSFYLNIITGQKIDAGVFEAAGDRGTAVHEILKLVVTGQGVDREALDPMLTHYLDEIEDWAEKYRPKVILCEKASYHDTLLYAGTPDLFCECRGIKRPVLLDGKSGMKGPVGLQTAAYEPLARKETGYKGLIDRYCLKLGTSGYDFNPCGSAQDFGIFKMKLAVYKFERSNI